MRLPNAHFSATFTTKKRRNVAEEIPFEILVVFDGCPEGNHRKNNGQVAAPTRTGE
ncbi:unnamed protein product [Victoria cruziana]